MAIKFNAAGEMIVELQLCKDRHPCPVEEAIFPNAISVMAFPKMELEAMILLKDYKIKGMQRLVIYTTGCNTALVAALNAATKLKIRDVVLLHWDMNNQDYQEQRFATFADVII